MIQFSMDEEPVSALHAPSPTVIKIIGCGGGGSSAVNRMIAEGVSGVDFVVLNTDVQALNVSNAGTKLAIGHQLTGGLGAGGNPQVGEDAAKEDADAIQELVSGANMVILTAGMGGGTGTGSVPIVAEIARSQGALTIAVVTTPFNFEGPSRMNFAQEGLRKLRQHVDCLIIIPNQQIMSIADKKMSYKSAFLLADDVLCQGVQGISEIITKPGEVNIDFADMKSVMRNQGDAILGVGSAEGENRAVEAARKAISNPMLDNRHIDGARNILVNITSSDDLTMNEIEELIKTITATADPNHKVFWGQTFDSSMGNRVSVTVIATGFEETEADAARAKAEREREENSNVMDLNDFDSLINGKSSMRSLSEPEPEIQGKFSPVNVDTSKVFGDSIPEEEQSILQALKQVQRTNGSSSITPPPSFTANPNDLQQPAVWRNAKRTLSRGIDLSQFD